MPGRLRLAAAVAVVVAAALLLAAPPLYADTPITLVKSFAGKLNFVGTEATLRTADNNTDACSVNTGASASLSGIPSGATIEAAYLYWAGSSTPGFWFIYPEVPPDYTVTFEGQSITAPTSTQYLIQGTGFPEEDYFSGVADVTPIVRARANPNGTYSLSGLTVDTTVHCNDQTVLAGWSLLVIYSDPTEDFRVVNIYQGFEQFQGSQIVLTPSNFRVPTSPINGKFAHITWEGDQTNSDPANGFVEALEFDGSSLTDTTNPPNEQFNSKSSIIDPPDDTSYGVDFDVYDISRYLKPGDTSATSTYSSGGDLVLLSAEVLSITNAAVSDLGVSLAHVGTPGPSGPIQYVVGVQNNGPLGEPGPITISLTLPAGLTYASYAGKGWSCSGSGTTATCTSSTPVAVGASLPPLTINGNIAVGTLSPVTTSVTVSGINFDNRSSNNTTTDSTTWVNPIPPPPIGEPGSFNITEIDADPHTGPIYTKIAGSSSYTLDLWAFKNNGGLENNPREQGELYLLDATDNSGGELPANSGCRSSWTRIADLGPFDFNRNNPLVVTLPAYANAISQARIQIVQNDRAETTACSSDAFAIRPAYFAITASQDSPKAPGTTTGPLNTATPAGLPYHRAGRPFTITLTPENGADTAVSGYTGGAPTITVTGIAAPAGGVLGTYGSAGAWTFSGGGAYTNTATYSEVGAFKAEATDAGFAAVDAGDGTPTCQLTIGLDCTQSANPPYWKPSTTIGRFTPDHFAAVRNTPSFRTGGGACPTATFTYVGQAFGFALAPVITVTAQNATNGTTKNYAGSWFKLSLAPDSVTGRTYQDDGAPPDAPLQTGGLPATGDPAIADNGDGTATLTFSAGSGFDYLHATPVAPFSSAIDLRITIKDPDGVAVGTIDGLAGANPVEFSDIAFNNGDQMRYGRMFISSAVGSELLNLPVAMAVQYYASAADGFVTNTKDTCTSLAASDIDLSNFQPFPGSLFAAGDTAATINTSGNGSFGLELTAPGAGKQGSVDISADLSALTWLQFDWNGDGTYNDDPTSRATFGLYKGDARSVYQHEVVGPGY